MYEAKELCTDEAYMVKQRKWDQVDRARQK